MSTTGGFALFTLLSLFLLSQSLADPSTSFSKPELESVPESEATAAVGSEIQETYRTVVFRPADLDGPADPDLIAHSFRLPSHHRFPHGNRHHHHRHHGGDGLIRMKTEESKWRDEHGSDVKDELEHGRVKKERMRRFGREEEEETGFGGEFKESEPVEEERKWRDEHDSDDEDEFEHKRLKKMRRMRRFGREEEDDEMEGRPHRGFGRGFPAEFKESDRMAMREPQRKWRDEQGSNDEDAFEHKRMRRFGREEEDEEMEGWGFMDRVRRFLNF